MSDAINLGGVTLDVEKALACACNHGSCWESQNDLTHYNECACPKVEGELALSAAPSGSEVYWEQILWGRLSKADLLEGLERLRQRIEAMPE